MIILIWIKQGTFYERYHTIYRQDKGSKNTQTQIEILNGDIIFSIRNEDEKSSRNKTLVQKTVSYQGHFASQEEFCLIMQGFNIIHHFYNQAAV